MNAFISFEGIDGSGKTTQLRLLSERLLSAKLSFQILREPGGTELGEKIRHMLLDAGGQMSDETELFLFFAARAELVRSVIRPALTRGELIICDRFYDSTLAYQGYGRGLGARRMQTLVDWAVGETRPDLTILVDTPVEVALSRMHRRDGEAADRIESEGARFMERVRQGYLELAKKEPQRFLVLDGILPEEKILNQLILGMKERLDFNFGV